MACGRSAAGGADAGDAGAAAIWWSTCGDRLINLDAGHRDSGFSPCTTQSAGAPCAPLGAECDPGNAVNSYLLCDTTDPKMGGCPISRMSYKDNIRYLSARELESYRDQLLSLPLATYRYRQAGPESRLHLGFMIDGHESLICVEPERDQVDLYSYTSMAVAALKVQAEQIEQLRKELTALRAEVAASRSSHPHHSRPTHHLP